MRAAFSQIVCVLILGLLPAAMPAVDNPVEYKSLADGGAVKFRGEYFFHGIGSLGDMYRSNDLTHWYDPVHALSNPDGDAPNFAANWPVDSEQAWLPPYGVGDDIYAMVIDSNYYRDGKLYTYYQIGANLGLAIGDEPQAEWENWPSSTNPQQFAPAYRIDPNLLIDEDGGLYFYAVQFSGGNVIAGQAMSDPVTLSGSPVVMVTAESNTWENRDEATPIIEGPEVIRYRDRYYMLYAANNTDSNESSGFGNYAVGVAESDTPLGFDNGDKYTDPAGNKIFVMDAAAMAGPRGRIFNTGQPWVENGPNGFEKWLGYFAIADGWGRNQFVDRIHFMNKRLTVDGPTNTYTEGYHPDPAMPQLRGLFNDPDGTRLQSDVWEVESGNWMVNGGALHQYTETAGGYRALLRDWQARHYLVEASLRFDNGATDHQAGLLAWYVDEDNFLLVGLHDLAAPATTNNFYYHLRQGGVDNVQAVGLDETAWPLGAWHTIRVERNGDRFTIRLDGLALPPVDLALGSGLPAGRVGLYANNGAARFDGMTYTIGWDEFDAGVSGWGDAASGTAAVGTWSGGAGGLAQTAASGGAFIFKGDPMPQYEAAVHITRDSTPVADSTMGLIPVAIDLNNYLAGMVLTDSGQFQVAGVKNGTPMTPVTVPLPRWVLSDTGQATGQSWKYTTTDPGAGWEAEAFNDSGWASGDSGFGKKQIWESLPQANIRTEWDASNIWLRRTFTLDQLPSIYSHLKLRMQGGSCEVYLNGVRADFSQTMRGNNFYQYKEFTNAARQALRVGTNVMAVHASDSSTPRFIDMGLFNSRLPWEGTAQAHIRAVKLADRVIFFVNGEQLVEVTGAYGSWPASQVALATANQAATFNGILVYQTSTELPAGWSTTDVGGTAGAAPGRSRYSSGLWTVEGSGAGEIWENSDQFHFLHRPWSGDVTIEARYDDAETTLSANFWAKAGLMLRETLDADSRHSFAQWAANKAHVSHVWRDATGGASGAIDQPGAPFELPVWMRLQRSGSLTRAYFSQDGLSWQLIDQRSYSMANDLFVGLASTSHDDWRQNTARFTRLRAWSPLPSPWASYNIGTASVAGSAGYIADGERFLIDASGSDIWLTNDGFRYLYQPWTGDMWFEARVTKIDDTDYWAKAGLMLREELSSTHPHASVFLTPEANPTLTMIRRETNGGQSLASDNFDGRQAPYYLRLVREGDTFSSYFSPDGLDWTLHASHTFTMAEAAYIGLAVTGHNNAALNRAEFNSLRLLGLPPEPWLSADVGAVGLMGMSGYHSADGRFEIDASGAEICCDADQFRFVYQEAPARGEIVARVVALENTGGRAKAGLMLRESLGTGSRHFAVELHGSGTLGSNRRLTTDGASGEEYASGSFGAPLWLRLVRSGSEVQLYSSGDGSNWTTVAGPYPETFPGGPAFFGMLVCSNNNADLTTAQFDQVEIIEYPPDGEEAAARVWRDY